jgi:hypothetical protein
VKETYGEISVGSVSEHARDYFPFVERGSVGCVRRCGSLNKTSVSDRRATMYAEIDSAPAAPPAYANAPPYSTKTQFHQNRFDPNASKEPTFQFLLCLFLQFS